MVIILILYMTNCMNMQLPILYVYCLTCDCLSYDTPSGLFGVHDTESLNLYTFILMLNFMHDVCILSTSAPFSTEESG